MKHYLLINERGYFMITEFEDGYKSYLAIEKELFCKISNLYEVVEVEVE